MATLRAGTVPCCQGSCFIKEEQFGVTAGRHQDAFSAAKLQDAHEPALDLPQPPNPASFVVQDTTVAQERTPFRGGDELTEWGHAVLSRHGRFSYRGLLYRKLETPLATDDG